MSEPTFHVEEPGPDPVGRRIELDPAETRHAASLRVRPGDTIRITDGRGRLWRARIEEAEGAAACTLTEALAPPPELPVEVAFGVGAKKRTLWLVEKAVELGAAALHPVECRRSASVADAARSTGFWRKARRRAVAALKQCGGARLPEVGPVCDLHDYLGRDRRAAPGGRLADAGPDLLLDREAGTGLWNALAGWDGERPVRFLLGPEGGLTGEERRACREAGFRPVRLGPRILRFETAAVAALSAAAARCTAVTGATREGTDG